MADPFADPTDVAARWRPLSAAETVVAQTLVVDASTLLRQRFPGIDDNITSGALDPNIATMVCAGMVIRALNSPDDGVASESATTGPFGRSVTYANPLRNVFLTAADVTLILGYQPTGQSNSFANDTVWCGPNEGEFVPTYDTLTVVNPIYNVP